MPCKPTKEQEEIFNLVYSLPHKRFIKSKDHAFEIIAAQKSITVKAAREAYSIVELHYFGVSTLGDK